MSGDIFASSAHSPEHDSCIRLVCEILALWPCNCGRTIEECRDRLKPYFASDFDEDALWLQVKELTKIKHILDVKGQVLIEFIDAYEYDIRAGFVKSKSGLWKLNNMSPRCPACFGTGEWAENSVCEICDGKGWILT